MCQWYRRIRPQLRAASTYSALLEGKSLVQIERRLSKLKSLQSRLHWPAITSFEASGRWYSLPLSACAPPDADIPLQRLQYLAGFFDGDGCVRAERLSVTQVACHAEVLWLMREAFGGGIYKTRDGRGLQQPCLKWAAYGASSRLAARQLLSYSFAKRAQLELIPAEASSEESRRKLNEILTFLKSEDSNEQIACSWPYVTGFFDAEGNIYIRPAEVRAELRMAQKHRTVIQWIRSFLQEELGGGIYFCQDSRGMHYLVISMQAHVHTTLNRFLENGLLVKKKQAEAALRLSKESHAELRGLSSPARGNQGKYRRHDENGDQRARELFLMRQRLNNYRAKGRDSTAKVELLSQQLDRLKEEHAWLNAASVHSSICSDIRKLIARGATRSEAKALAKRKGDA